jgi:ribosome maturation factor RimP
MLDSADYIKEQYFLEISSPGVERVLRKTKHFEQNIGKEISVSLFRNFNNTKKIEGILKKFDNANIYIEINSEILEIDRKNISLVKTKFEW